MVSVADAVDVVVPEVDQVEVDCDVNDISPDGVGESEFMADADGLAVHSDDALKSGDDEVVPEAEVVDEVDTGATVMDAVNDLSADSDIVDDIEGVSLKRMVTVTLDVEHALYEPDDVDRALSVFDSVFVTLAVNDCDDRLEQVSDVDVVNVDDPDADPVLVTLLVAVLCNDRDCVLDTVAVGETVKVALTVREDENVCEAVEDMLDVEETVFDCETVDVVLYVPESVNCEFVADVVVEADTVVEADRETVVDAVLALEALAVALTPQILLSLSQKRDEQSLFLSHAAPITRFCRYRSARVANEGVNAVIQRSNTTQRMSAVIIC